MRQGWTKIDSVRRGWTSTPDEQTSSPLQLYCTTQATPLYCAVQAIPGLLQGTGTMLIEGLGAG